LRLSILAQVRTFYRRDRSCIDCGGAGGGAIDGRSLTPFPGDAGTPSIDRHSGQWRARNVAKRPWEGATMETQWPIGPWMVDRGIAAHPVRCRWTISSRRGMMGAAKLHAAAGSPAPWRTCQNADVQRDGGDAIADQPSHAGYGRHEARRRTRPDDRPTSQWSFLFPMRPLQSASIEAD